MIRAAIAIGSNSTRMLAASMDGSAPMPLIRLREDTKLFSGLTEEGALSEEAMERTAKAVVRLKNAALNAGCDENGIDLYATSATRDALNREAFALRLRSSAGLFMYVMTGKEEAELAFTAVADGTGTLVADIGGGSTELTYGRDRVEDSVSLQAGASRLMKAVPIRSPADVLPLTAQLRPMIRTEAGHVTARRGSGRLVLLGGSGTAAGDLIALRYPDDRRVTTPRVLALAEELADIPPQMRRSIPGLPPAKADHIVHGLCILYAVLAETGAQEAEISLKTNLDGWMRRMYNQTRAGSQGGLTS